MDTKKINPNNNADNQKGNTADNAAKAAANIGGAKVIKLPTQVLTEPKAPTLQDFKDKAVTAFHLQQKHSELTKKRRDLEEFAITSDSQNATIKVTDNNGKSFSSSNPKSMKRLIEYWKEEFTTAIEEVENELTALFAPQTAEIQALEKAA